MSQTKNNKHTLTELEQATLERDAAIADIMDMGNSTPIRRCCFCKYWKDAEHCKHGGDCFVWRGISEEAMKLRYGSPIFVIERDGSGNAFGVQEYVLLALSDGKAFASTRIYGATELSDYLNYYTRETAEYGEASISVFPIEDCYAARDAACEVCYATGEDDFDANLED